MAPRRDGDDMRIGIVSDTHDDVELAEAAAERFAGDAETVIHCGDVIAPFSAAAFDRDEFEFYCARGNNDGEWKLRDTVESFGEYLGEVGELTLGGKRVAVYHGTGRPLVDALVDCGRYDYALHGHTHRRGREERGETVRINPGGVPIPVEGADDAFHVALLETETGEVEFETLG